MAPIPHLRKTDKSFELIVNGEPFLMLCGELQNSSMSSARYMKNVWPSLVENNYNTILGSVAWEDIEPIEGNFDFNELDKILQDARQAGLKLVLLWFGAFKNGDSTTALLYRTTLPHVKQDRIRFPRAELSAGKGQSRRQLANALSIFNPELVIADAKAFGALLSHIKEVDSEFSTVLMVQVENEIGLLGDSRDRSDLADKVFLSDVPQELLESLGHREWDSLRPELRNKTLHNKQVTLSDGCWTTVFGDSGTTDELFMAYHFAKYVDIVASVGKSVYPIPLFTNVWQALGPDDANADMPAFISAIVAEGKEDEPGFFPSGGGTIRVLDIWQLFAKALDFVAPDVYLSDYEKSCEKYSHRGQPLFIPEQRRDEYGARRIWSAVGTYNCLGCSPFGIDTVSPSLSPFTKHYRLLAKVAPILLQYRQHGATFGFFFDGIIKGKEDIVPARTIVFGDYELSIARSFVFGQPSPGCGLVIHLGASKFLLVGWGFQVTFSSVKAEARFTGILRFSEMEMQDGALHKLRSLNGDETRSGLYAIMPSDDPDYGDFPVSVTIPAHTYIAECEPYTLY